MSTAEADEARRFVDELRQALARKPKAERQVVFVGVLNKHIGARRPAVLVGGALVEFYTGGAYVTGDIDLIGDGDVIVRLLTAAGFERSGRVFVHTDLELTVDVAGDTLRQTETVESVEVAGYRVPAVSVEDAIVDRLLAAKYWRSRTDWEQAVLLWMAHRDRIRRDELIKKARANEVEDKLEALMAV